MRERMGRIAWAMTLVAVACAVQEGMNGGAGGAPEERKAPLLTVNHALHAENGLDECFYCHDPEEKGEPGPPSAEFCFECHDDIENDTDKVKAYFAAAKRDDEYVWPRQRERTKDLLFSHASHTGAYEVDCAFCHGEPSAKAFVRKAPLAMKALCFECHDDGEQASACATCHVKTRKDAWKDGGTWREPSGGSCALCHSVPEGCHECHREAVPDSHRAEGFRRAHGGGFLDAGLVPFEDSSCSLCHEEQSCVRCHQTTKPRNHTLAWQRRFHGVQASVDRTSCLVCHRQDFCVHCHETAQQLSHRGNFARGAQSHCVACHEPLTATGCFTCHKNTRGHLTAPPLPAGPPHAGARDCRLCHRALKHFDDGLSCRRCHR